jgi:hypothetical protein
MKERIWDNIIHSVEKLEICIKDKCRFAEATWKCNEYEIDDNMEAYLILHYLNIVQDKLYTYINIKYKTMKYNDTSLLHFEG